MIVALTLLVIVSIGILDYFIVLKSHKSLYANLLFITLLMSVSFFVFITLGLYKGIRLKENIGKLTDHIDTKKLPDFSGGVPDLSAVMQGFGAIAEGLGGLVIAILSAVVLIMLGWFLILSSWFVLIFLAAVLYWVYFRALRLVFKRSGICQGNIIMSLKYAGLYSLLYTSWIFAFIVTLHYCFLL
jgi:phosphoglycerol transferase MdoB-like AlkP superfamily enzyme